VKFKGLSLNEPVRREEYGWIKSVLRERNHAETPREDDPREHDPPEHEQEVGVMVESDLVRTVLFTFALGVLACLTIYFSYHVAAGEGRRVFAAMASLAAFLACGAVASRGRFLLRFVFGLGCLCAVALLVDQLVYYRWQKRVDSVVTTLQRSVDAGATVFSDKTKLRPTSFRIDPDREVVLRFEPPALAWTYHLDAASPLGHTLVGGWYRLLTKVTRGRNLDSVARTIVRPHEVYAVSVTPPGDGILACQADDAKRRGRRPL